MAEIFYDNVPIGVSAIELSRKDKKYLDISLSFQANPLNGDITKLKNERAINNAIKNIILTLPGEKPFDHSYGSTTQRSLFEICDYGTAGLLSNEIQRAILYNEPRVTFEPPNPADLTTSRYRDTAVTTPGNLFVQDDLGVFVDPQPDKNAFEINVKYRIIGGEKIFRIQEILTPTN